MKLLKCMSTVRKRLALCSSYSCSVLSLLWYKNIPHIPVSHLLTAVSPASLFRKALTIPPTEQKERESAEQTWIEFGNDCSDVAKQPNIPQWKETSPISLLVSSCFPCRFLSVSLSHFPLCQRNLPSSWECSFNLEILPCLSEACETLLRVGHDYCSSSFQMYTTVSS